MDGIMRLARHLGMTALRLVFVTTIGNLLPMTVDPNFLPDPVYDFVVVGSGAAGSVVAGRLSESGARVLVLEAGKSAPPESAVPGLIGVNFGQESDWNIPAEPQPNAQQAYKDNRIYQPVGRALGGSTSINGMIYVRGNKRDFDHWASLGNRGWDYESVLPYFKKSENFKGFQTAETDRYHGTGGPLSVETSNFAPRAAQAFYETGEELGYGGKIDDSGPSQIGFAAAHFTMGNGMRASASEAFLRPNQHRPNLHIRDSALVTKIIFDSKKRARGVRYVFNKQEREVRVRKEVIVCAGAILSPKLLMLSGVGPREHLREMGVPLVAAVEGVGRNLQDHPTAGFGLVWGVKPGTAMSITDLIRPIDGIKYLKERTGFYANPYAALGMAWLHLADSGDPHWPDTSITVSPLSQALDFGLATGAVSNLRTEAYKDIFGPLLGREAITFQLFLCRPKSRGWIKLKSSDPNEDPRVNNNLLDHPDDLEMLLRGVKMAFRMANTTVYREEMGAAYVSKPLRYCRHLPVNVGEYWRCYLRHNIATAWHPAGTCKMAPLADPAGVVSPRLRLRGVSGVRVVDASVMPTVVGTNTMATTIMIGEKGADLIKQDWGYRTQPS